MIKFEEENEQELRFGLILEPITRFAKAHNESDASSVMTSNLSLVRAQSQYNGEEKAYTPGLGSKLDTGFDLRQVNKLSN